MTYRLLRKMRVRRTWCWMLYLAGVKKWLLRINSVKSKVVHFRKRRLNKSVGGDCLDYSLSYEYLDVILIPWRWTTITFFPISHSISLSLYLIFLSFSLSFLKIELQWKMKYWENYQSVLTVKILRYVFIIWILVLLK